MANAPHLAVFSQPYAKGREADLTIFRRTAASYKAYVTKTAQDIALCPQDGHQEWAILGDNAYQHTPVSAPGVRLLFIPRRAVQDEHRLSKQRLRLPIEWFFGRMAVLFRVSSAYRWNLGSFDIDFDNMVLLTNLHIEDYHALGTRDGASRHGVSVVARPAL